MACVRQYRFRYGCNGHGIAIAMAAGLLHANLFIGDLGRSYFATNAAVTACIASFDPIFASNSQAVPAIIDTRTAGTTGTKTYLHRCRHRTVI